MAPQVSAAPAIYPTLHAGDKPVLLPVPKKLIWATGYFNLPASLAFSAPAEYADTIKKICEVQLGIAGVANNTGPVKFIKNSSLQNQAYHLSVQSNGITIEYNNAEGIFYAFTTLKQLASQSNNQLPSVQIEDQPDLQTRAVLLDIKIGRAHV